MTIADRLTILAVDDNPINLKLLESTLTREGYRVITSLDGPAARKIAVDEKPDLILLDIMMPEEDGFEVIKFLKKNSHTASIPVIFLTGMTEIDSKLEGFELGAVDYIIKPFHPLEVLARVGLHLKLSVATNSLIEFQAQKLKQLTDAQTSMLTTPESYPGANFGVYYKALHEAGGDFYDVLPVSKEIYVYFVADFSGHDISTSYLTASAKALLKQNCTPLYQAVESVKLINDVFVEILPEGKYLTACYAKLNRETKQMVIVNAGHPPVVYTPVEDESRLIEIEGDILGIFNDVVFGQETITVSPGDRFFIYSDGLVESTKDKITWNQGASIMLDACDAVRNVPIKEAPGKIIHHLIGDPGQAEDDLVILGIEI